MSSASLSRCFGDFTFGDITFFGEMNPEGFDGDGSFPS
jgi:hypothetical protein